MKDCSHCKGPIDPICNLCINCGLAAGGEMISNQESKKSTVTDLEYATKLAGEIIVLADTCKDLFAAENIIAATDLVKGIKQRQEELEKTEAWALCYQLLDEFASFINSINDMVATLVSAEENQLIELTTRLVEVGMIDPPTGKSSTSKRKKDK